MARRTWSVPVELPVRYRLGDDPCWRTGITTLLTESEAFIQTDRDPVPAVPVTMIVSLPGANQTDGGCVVACGVIRSRLDHKRGALGTFVVDITNYRLTRIALAMRNLEVHPPAHAAAAPAGLRSEYRVH